MRRARPTATTINCLVYFTLHVSPRTEMESRFQLIQGPPLISFTSVQATQGVRGCVRTERNKGCPHLKKRPGPDGPSIPHVMSGPVQKS